MRDALKTKFKANTKKTSASSIKTVTMSSSGSGLKHDLLSLQDEWRRVTTDWNHPHVLGIKLRTHLVDKAGPPPPYIYTNRHGVTKISGHGFLVSRAYLAPKRGILNTDHWEKLLNQEMDHNGWHCTHPTVTASSSPLSYTSHLVTCSVPCQVDLDEQW